MLSLINQPGKEKLAADRQYQEVFSGRTAVSGAQFSRCFVQHQGATWRLQSIWNIAFPVHTMVRSASLSGLWGGGVMPGRASFNSLKHDSSYRIRQSEFLFTANTATAHFHLAGKRNPFRCSARHPALPRGSPVLWRWFHPRFEQAALAFSGPQSGCKKLLLELENKEKSGSWSAFYDWESPPAQSQDIPLPLLPEIFFF